MISHFEKTKRSEIFGIKILREKIGGKKLVHHTLVKGDSPIDFTLDNNTYDVKYSNPVFIKQKQTIPIWGFDLRNKKDYCDFLLLIGMIKGEPKQIFLLPTYGLPKRNIRISIFGVSKWHKYRIWKIK